MALILTLTTQKVAAIKEDEFLSRETKETKIRAAKHYADAARRHLIDPNTGHTCHSPDPFVIR